MPNDPSINGTLLPSGGSTSSSLLGRVRQHDEDAWQRLVTLYTPLIYGWCRRYELGPEDAADTVQEVFQAVYTSLEGFRKDQPGCTFRGWLWTITRNRILNRFRAEKGHPHARGGTDAQGQLAHLPEAAPDPAEDRPARAADASRLLQQNLDPVRAQFEDRTWQAFWRTVIREEPVANVADELGITVNAVRKARCRVLRRLREERFGLGD